MAENVSERSNAYNIIGWLSFALGLFVTPLFAIIGIIVGIVSSSKEHGKGTAVIWANSILLILGSVITWLFYGIAGFAFFQIFRNLFGY